MTSIATTIAQRDLSSNKVEAARAAARQHVESCLVCSCGITGGDEPAKFCATGWTLWARFELERDMAAEKRIEIVFTRGADGRLEARIVGDLAVEEARVLCQRLVNHVIGDCCDCPGYEAGYEAGLEAPRRPYGY